MSSPNRRPRAADAPPLLLPLDAGRPTPLHRQLYDALRDAILARRLAPNERLPSTRALAADLGVSRNTVTLAFEQLRTEGYVAGRRGGGTRVRSTIPDRVMVVRPRRTVQKSRPRSRPTSPPAPPRLSARGAMLAAAGRTLVRLDDTAAVPFRLGIPAIDAFPVSTWARLEARAWRRGGPLLGDADPAGERPLRDAIAAYVAKSRGARCTADHVLVVSGTQQALDLVGRVLLDVGDAAWVEDPGYFGAFTALVSAGARLVPVRVDAEGLDVAAGERLAPDARVAYVTPSHQFPLGSVMSASRRLALLAWARRAEAWIVEDDYDSEFRYAGRPLPCLQGMDDGERVLYVGTFNKTVAPALRLGYLVVPDALVDAFRAARSAIDRHPSTISQDTLADFIADGHFARHVRRVRALYAERQHALLDAARDTLDDVLTLAPDPAGLHLVGWLRDGDSDAVAAARAKAAGVEVTPLSCCAIAPVDRGALLLSYAGFDPRAIREATATLARALA